MVRRFGIQNRSGAVPVRDRQEALPSIDSPQFLDAEDPRLGDAGIDDATRIIGFVHAGDARAYPLDILDRHELVNDTVGGKPVTVGW